MARSPEVDDYIAGFPPDVGRLLSEIRDVISARLPGADEAISYRIPVFQLDGRDVIYFAGWQKHVSVYPVPEATPEIADELAGHRAGKGTLKFPLGESLPAGLIGEVAELLVEQRHR